MKKHCFDIIKPSKPTNVLTNNKPLNRAAVVIFLPKMYRLFISSTIKHELSRALADLLNAIFVSVKMCLVKVNVKTFI